MMPTQKSVARWEPYVAQLRLMQMQVWVWATLTGRNWLAYELEYAQQIGHAKYQAHNMYSATAIDSPLVLNLSTDLTLPFTQATQAPDVSAHVALIDGSKDL